MNLPYSWLKELLPNAPGPEKLVDLLPQLGLGVEAVHELAGSPEGVVVGLIEEATPIEGSDHLLACTVSDGDETYSVVCGAPNVHAGMCSALAKPGAYLPGAGFKVDKRKMLGVASEGVLCSPKELELYDYGGGIMEFGDDVEIGISLNKVWPAETVLELEITPNRGDALSILGVARDLSAKLGIPLKHPAEGLNLGDTSVDDGLTVKVEDTEGCPRFTVQRIDGVTVGPSPVWLQRRLASVGLRPRNNVVDITNFVTFELGHPSHAYDLDNLNDNTIVVRRAVAEETVETLGEETLKLDPNDLIITMPKGNGTEPIGVAGVIGGLHDSVNSNTKNVTLELAHWDPVTIRKTAKRHGVMTEAHYRFERGVDPNLPPQASARAAQLIAELAGGTVHPGFTDVGEVAPLKRVPFRPSRVKSLMALDVPLDNQKQYLEALGCKVEERDEDDWLVTTPSWRFDLEIEEDLIEEVSRLYGYDAIGETVPAMYFVPDEADPTHNKLRLLLAGFGLQELITYIFTSDAELERARAPQASVRLTHPQGIERSVLRTSLYPGLLNVAALNSAQPSLAVFEIGRVFGEVEAERLGILLQGPSVRGGWMPDEATDFYVLKGLLEKFARTLGVDLQLEPAEVPHLHPGVSARVLWNAREVGTAGRLHPEIAAAYGLSDVYLAELAMPLEGAEVNFSDYARQPHAERDLAVIAPKEVTYKILEAVVQANGSEYLERVSPFDIYEGSPIPEDQRSVAMRLWFRHPERALNDAEVDGFMANVITALRGAGYAIRD